MVSRILIVDDDPFYRKLLVSAFDGQGHHIATTSNGADALFSFVEEHFDLIIIDYKMPGLDGVLTARAIRDITNTRGMPRLVALTARPEELAARECREGVTFDWIIPKAHLERVIQTICSFLKADPGQSVQRSFPRYH